jgi:hypothetical protein
VGSANNGANSSAQTNVNFSRNQVAGTLVNPVVFNNAGTLNMHGNEFGVNVTVQASTKWLYATGNAFAAGKSLTDEADFSTIEARALRKMTSTPANAARVDTLDNTLKVLTQALTRTLAGYVQKVVDALNFEWRLSGSTTNKMSLVAAGHLQTSASIRPGALGASAAQQTATGMWAVTGAPSNTYGQDGDFCFRSDGTVAGNTVMYHKEGGAWVAFTTT